jgi:exodeoxyribonuclease VII small subunit
MARSAAASADSPANSPANDPANQPATYEQALAELDRLVAQMEGGQLPLDQLLDGYRRGAELLNFCRAKLQDVEAQVKVLEDGQLKTWTAT